MTKETAAVIIPARYASTRFPAKPLAVLAGKPMIQHTWEQAIRSKADKVLVATDHQSIIDAVTAFGGTAVMTREDHASGTDRIYEASCSADCDIIINVQGDEPLIPPEIINTLIDLMRENPEYEMATVAVPASQEILSDPNKVKVVMANNGYALYFSRAPIPFLRTGGKAANALLHWGIYAFRRESLAKFVQFPPSALENCEKLEQLRALENGMRIQVVVRELESVGVDTPEDLAAAEKLIASRLAAFNGDK